MSTFERNFTIEKITKQVLEAAPWFEDMLLSWRPAGDGHMTEESPRHLRLAIRNGYLNFYRGGQSLARIGFGTSGDLQARIHNKYVHGEKGSGQTYLTLGAAGFLDKATNEPRAYLGRPELDDWVANANEHVGYEKEFVDLIVARNPNTIDLEMALPAYSPVPKERIAPRMDLVAIEPVGDRWRIVFWEAKLVDDPRLRCWGDDKSPEVVDQIAQYTSWLGHANLRELVARAYQNACRLLVKFHELAKRMNPGIEELGLGIVAAAAPDAPSLLVDDQPRLLIDDRTRSSSFTKNGHLDKLRNKGIHVQMVHPESDMTLEARH